MKKIEAVSVWWYAHHPADIEVNFYHQNNKWNSYYVVTPSSRKRLGDALLSFQPNVGIGAEYTSMYYAIKDKS